MSEDKVQNSATSAVPLHKIVMQYKLIKVEPPPQFIKSSGRWKWLLPENACSPGCCTSVVSASREWWEYTPSEARPHLMAEAVMLRNGIWYWAVPA